MPDYLILLAAYLVGAIPFSFLIARFASGIDLRQAGSGNVGATNVLRTTGRGPAIAAFLCDFLKGFLPVFIAQAVNLSEQMIMATGLCAILGHLFPFALKFKGGKGVSTSFGVLWALAPMVTCVILAVWLLGAQFGKYASVGALAAFLVLPFLVLWLKPELVFFSILLAALIYTRHWKNIQRLMKGEEKKSSFFKNKDENSG